MKDKIIKAKEAWNNINPKYRRRKMETLGAMAWGLNDFKKIEPEIFEKEMKEIGILWEGLTDGQKEKLKKDKRFKENYLDNLN